MPSNQVVKDTGLFSRRPFTLSIATERIIPYQSENNGQLNKIIKKVRTFNEVKGHFYKRAVSARRKNALVALDGHLSSILVLIQ
ncbi:hypothetical protein D8M05_16235 [Oceanobacillus bengalensis]|uniref:Uncharacterized protein n=2 Tax=Oceanobacillus bengalensis TaxID=1435466 RepID=A0A494YTH9_9BACI|nr:hypothetical protein D8M05_16235 [Oceanobacillus bengalensis]